MVECFRTIDYTPRNFNDLYDTLLTTDDSLMLIGYKIAKKFALFNISKSGYLNFELIQGATLKIPEVIFLLFQILDNVGFVELLKR